MKGKVTKIYKIIGKKLEEERIANNFCQNDFANKVGVTLQQIAKYEKGINRIPVDKLFILACILNRDINFFLV